MPVSAEELDRRMHAFREACARRDVKLTHQRIEIYRELAGSDEHPDAEAIYQRVRERITTISRDTVYRNLRALADQGLVSIVGMSHDRIRFDPNVDQHHHFVCVRCGSIRDFHAASLDGLALPEEASAHGTPLSMCLEVKGVCAACRAADGKRH